MGEPGKKGKREAARELFMKEVLELLRENDELELIVPNLEAFSIQVGTEEPGRTIYLQNFFDELRDVEPETRTERLRGKLRTMLEDDDPPESWESVQDKLLSVVRTASYATGTGPLAKKMLMEPLAPFLRTGVVIDYPSKMLCVMQDQLEKWGVSAQQVFERGAQNLTRLQSSLGRYGETDSIQYLVDEDSYEAARLTSPHFLLALAGAIGVKGRLVVAIPHRSLLLATDDATSENVLRLARTAEREYDSSPRKLSPALYTIDAEGRCQPYLRAGKDETAHAVALSHRLLALSEYGEQKANLDREHEAAKQDIFVASYKLMTTNGAPWSYALWLPVHAWLPEVDFVCFNRSEAEKLFFVPWQRTAELVGELWQSVPKSFPARVEAVEFPSDALYEKLRACAVDPP